MNIIRESATVAVRIVLVIIFLVIGLFILNFCSAVILSMIIEVGTIGTILSLLFWIALIVIIYGVYKSVKTS